MKTIIDENDLQTSSTEKDDISKYFEKYNKAATVENVQNSPGDMPANESKPFISIKDTESPKTEEKPKRRRKKKIENQIISGEILSGALFLTIVDMLLPMLIAVVNNALSKDKIKGKDLSLTQTQRNQLEPIADSVMKQIELNTNPVLILILSMGGLYGMNYMAAKYKLDENTLQ